ncbi:MAG: transglutaminase-like domain-containing protein, partial [Eubacteriales bacterium]
MKKQSKPEAQAEKTSASRVQNRFLLHPGTQGLSGKTVFLGLFLRLIPAFCLCAGLYLFCDNAFGFETNRILFLSVIAVSLLLGGAMCLHRSVCIGGGVLLAALTAVFFLWRGQNPVSCLVSLVRSTFNSAITHMMTIGYGVLYVFRRESDLTYEEELAEAQLFFLILWIAAALIVSFCTMRKIRVFPIAVLTASAYTVVFLYNISTAKWGFALSVCGIVGLLCMKLADRYTACYAFPSSEEPSSPPDDSARIAPLSDESAESASSPETHGTGKQKKPTPSRHTYRARLAASAAIGYSGFLATAVALLAIAVPAAAVKSNWKTYDKIDTVMEIIRSYEMALITGEDMQISDLGLTGAAEILEARSSIASPRYYTGQTVLEVQSNLTLPVYLRSWVSTTFRDDMWYVADEAERDLFDELFESDFRAEDMTYRFFRNLNEKLVRLGTKTSYSNHEEDGFMTTLISLKNTGVSGNILFLPSRFDSETSLLQYGELDLPYAKNWINYFDGIAYSRAFHKGAKYSTIAFIPLYKDEGWMQSLNQKRITYSIFLSLYHYIGSGNMAVYLDQDDGENTAILSSLVANPYPIDRLKEYYLSLDTEGQALFDAEINETDAYNDYVMRADSPYLSLSDDETLNRKLRKLAIEIVFADPLPDTGILINFTDNTGMQTTVDLTDAIGLTATSVPVYDTDSGILSDPPEMLVTATEIRGTDGSLIDTEYTVNDPEAFYAYLTERWGTGFPYDTMFAQRIAEYLSENMTYTLNPAVPETDDDMSSVERFLFVTKEGYCVQYATAATLLLRALGIPTRYVEGYIAPKFVRNTAEDKVGSYICNVKDYNAHAWCEIYLENYGWMTTEVTTPYYSDLY